MRADVSLGPDRDERTAGTAPIAVVIPAYNAGRFIAATVQSAFAQTLRPREVIVADDGSTDDTVAVARANGATVITLTNRGPSAARNAGTAAATSEYIAYLDADDLWEPEKLAVQFAALAAYRQPAFSFTDHREFDDAGIFPMRSGLRSHPAFRRVARKTMREPMIVIGADERRPVLADMYFLPSSTLIRRADVLAVGGFDERLRLCEDYEFFLRLFRRVPAIAIMQPLLLYRRHPRQTSAATITMMSGLFEIERVVESARDRYPPADVAYIAQKGYLLHYRIGVCLARLGQFDAAIESLRRSVAMHRTLAATAVLAASCFGRSRPGRALFTFLRAIRRSTFKRRGVALVE